MLPFSLNSICAPALNYRDLAGLARETDCHGMEVRNDLGRPVFDDDEARTAGQYCRDAGVSIFAIAEVPAFNRPSNKTLEQTESLARMAAECGSDAIVLIPNMRERAGEPDAGECGLSDALSNLLPVLNEFGVLGLIEPLGFENSSLRLKSDAVAAIDQLDAHDTFRLVHDTFHHYLAGEETFYPAHTHIVHVSSVTDPNLSPEDMRDEHRVLVGEEDRLGTIEQLRELRHGGFRGPVSFEPFAPEVHALDDPKAEILGSIRFIESRMAAMAA